MNKLLFHEGGQPFNLNDLDFLQGNFISSLKAIGSTLPDGIYGAQFKYPKSYDVLKKLSWKDALVVLKGNILPLKAGEIYYSFRKPIYAKVVKEVGTPRTYEDGSEHPTQEVYKVVITQETPQGDDFLEVTHSPNLLTALKKANIVMSSASTNKGENIAGRVHILELPNEGVSLIRGSLQLEAGGGETYQDGKIAQSAASEDYKKELAKYNGGCLVFADGIPRGTMILFDKGELFLMSPSGQAYNPPSTDPFKRMTISFAYVAYPNPPASDYEN